MTGMGDTHKYMRTQILYVFSLFLSILPFQILSLYIWDILDISYVNIYMYAYIYIYIMIYYIKIYPI
jgi:hypothetical protein